MNTYLVVDLEMTGLAPTKDRILEIGAVYLRDGAVAETFSTLVNPERKLSDHIRELTGITDAMVADAPTIRKALSDYLDFAGDTVIIGHNLIYDYSFLKQNALNLGFSYGPKGIDTLKLARTFLDPELPKGLEDLCQYLRLERGHGHRALDDALVTAKLFLYLKDHYGKLKPEAFSPMEFHYKAKKQGPATPAQKRDLKHLIAYHKIDENVAIDSLTKSEASRMIDRIYAEYGRIPKEQP